MTYLLKKSAILLFTLFCIVTLTFILMKAIPGDPFSEEQPMPKEILESLKHHYGLDQPLYIQYGMYLKSIATWNLGPSYKYKSRTVNDIIKDGFPISAILGLEALFLSISVGIFLGTVAAVRQNKWQDHAAMLIAVAGTSIPSFIFATLLQYALALKLGLFPIALWGTFSHTVLPAIALAALPTAFIARLTRANMLEVLHQDYIKAAKAKGLSEQKVLTRHAMRNALLPVIAYLGQLTANIIPGSFIIERIFGIPGLGQWFVNSVTNRDYTVIMGTTVFYSIILLVMTFLIDILYGLVNPRIGQEAS